MRASKTNARAATRARTREKQAELCYVCHKSIRADHVSKSGFHGRDRAGVAGAGVLELPHRARGARRRHHGARSEDVRAHAHEFPAARRARRRGVHGLPHGRKTLSRDAAAMQRLPRGRGSAQGLARRIVRGLPHVDGVEADRLRSLEDALRAHGRARQRHARSATATSSSRVRRRSASVPSERGQARGPQRRRMRRLPHADRVGCELRSRGGGRIRLAGKHQQLKCEGCHTKSLSVALPKTCVGCHQKDDPAPG